MTENGESGLPEEVEKAINALRPAPIEQDEDGQDYDQEVIGTVRLRLAISRAIKVADLKARAEEREEVAAIEEDTANDGGEAMRFHLKEAAIYRRQLAALSKEDEHGHS